MPPFQPDPLSVRYEKVASAFLTRAIEAMDRSRVSQRWVLGIVESATADEPREPGGQHLSRSERAFQRALYRDPRVYHRSDAKRYSLKEPVWGEVIGRRRFIQIRVFSDTAGSRYRKPRGEGSYVRKPALRSKAAVIQMENDSR